jgi:glucose-6-phosphate 1-dehydrogenase
VNDVGVLVLFGASGDLARKSLFPALYRLEERGELDQRIIGIALDTWDRERFRRHVEDALSEAIPQVDRGVEQRLTDRLDYVAGDYEETETFELLADAVGDSQGTLLIYLAIPPTLFETVLRGLADHGLAGSSRILVEKPLGRDLDGARHLNRVLRSVVPETSIYRIDHFLGKEPVENLLAFRYANPVFESVWDNRHIDHVQVTMAESFGVGDRGALYDSLGVVRDVVQNHLLQVVCLLTMEAPSSPEAESFAAERRKVLSAIPEITDDDIVFGQYRGYQDIDQVASDSTTPTFAALRLAVESPRWSGVPFFIRSGKELAATATQAVVVFKTPPPLPFGSEPRDPEPNRLIFEIKPKDGVDLFVQTKLPGEGVRLATTRLSVDYDSLFGRIPLAYERVLYDALTGDRSQFADEEAVEEAWRIVDGVADPPGPPPVYEPGGWGPPAAARVPGPDREWFDPARLRGEERGSG